MTAQTSMLHVRVDDQLKARATDALSGVGLTLSDAVRILLTRVAAEGGMPAGLTTDPEVYDNWFRTKVQEALADPHAATPHDQVIQKARALIDTKRHA
jgi:DNA-damage-inducible protein J